MKVAVSVDQQFVKLINIQPTSPPNVEVKPAAAAPANAVVPSAPVAPVCAPVVLLGVPSQDGTRTFGPVNYQRRSDQDTPTAASEDWGKKKTKPQNPPAVVTPVAAMAATCTRSEARDGKQEYVPATIHGSALSGVFAQWIESVEKNKLGCDFEVKFGSCRNPHCLKPHVNLHRNVYSVKDWDILQTKRKRIRASSVGAKPTDKHESALSTSVSPSVPTALIPTNSRVQRA